MTISRFHKYIYIDAKSSIYIACSFADTNRTGEQAYRCGEKHLQAFNTYMHLVGPTLEKFADKFASPGFDINTLPDSEVQQWQADCGSVISRYMEMVGRQVRCTADDTFTQYRDAFDVDECADAATANLDFVAQILGMSDLCKYEID